jgi:hypothetical protein
MVLQLPNPASSQGVSLLPSTFSAAPSAEASTTSSPSENLSTTPRFSNTSFYNGMSNGNNVSGGFIQPPSLSTISLSQISSQRLPMQQQIMSSSGGGMFGNRG